MTEILSSSARLQLRRGRSEVLAQANEVLLAGEIVIETDTGRMKAGDGVRSWNDLPYSGSLPRVTESHTLTADEAAHKSFSLSNEVEAGQEENVMLFALGVLQKYGQDYEVSGKAVTWEGKGLSDVALREGDTFQIIYERA